MQFLEKGCKGMVRMKRPQKIRTIKYIACILFLDCLSRMISEEEPLFNHCSLEEGGKSFLFLNVCWFSFSLSTNSYCFLSLQHNVATPQTIFSLFFSVFSSYFLVIHPLFATSYLIEFSFDT